MSDDNDTLSLDPVTRAAYLLAIQDPEERLRAISKALGEQDRLRHLLDRSVRIEEIDFVDGEKGCCFVLGEDHIVVQWSGDGVSRDTVVAEQPALEYGVTTTAFQRCMRMVFELAHWPVVCAMVAGPGDGQLGEIEEMD